MANSVRQQEKRAQSMTADAIKCMISNIQSADNFKHVAGSSIFNEDAKPATTRNDIVRAGLFYAAADLEQLRQIGAPDNAAELTALSHLMRALANS